MKKVINNSKYVVEEMLEGMTYAYPQYVKKLDNANVLVRQNIKTDGEYMTSIGMAGFSVSLLKLDDELKELLDAKADTPAFKQL